MVGRRCTRADVTRAKPGGLQVQCPLHNPPCTGTALTQGVPGHPVLNSCHDGVNTLAARRVVLVCGQPAHHSADCRHTCTSQSRRQIAVKGELIVACCGEPAAAQRPGLPAPQLTQPPWPCPSAPKPTVRVVCAHVRPPDGPHETCVDRVTVAPYHGVAAVARAERAAGHHICRQIDKCTTGLRSGFGKWVTPHVQRLQASRCALRSKGHGRVVGDRPGAGSTHIACARQAGAGACLAVQGNVM